MVDAVGTNCACDAGNQTETLGTLRSAVAVRLGFGAAGASAPGMTDLLNSFVVEAQNLLFRRNPITRLERWWTWSMTAGTRFYDFDADDDVDCPKKLDPLKVRWVGVSQTDTNWLPLAYGIDPLMFSNNIQSIPSRYEIRQCIEVLPAPPDDTWKLRIKGEFGLLSFKADTDICTVDPQAIKLLALANAKAHYGQPDAAAPMNELQVYLGDLVAAGHQTKRYIPGTQPQPYPPLPKMKDAP